MSTGCYWPNGDEVAPDLNYSRCPPNPIPGRDQTHVTCCDNNAVCTDQGLCVGTANFYYRGACTDKTWASSACAAECVATLANDNFNQAGFVNLLPCANGTGDIQWCCDQGSAGCCGSASDIILGRLYAWPVDHIGETSASASASAASPSTPSGSTTTPSASSIANTNTAAVAAATTIAAPASNSGGKEIALGVGLGVGLGLLLLIVAMGVFMVKGRKRRIQLEKQILEIDSKLALPSSFTQDKIQLTTSTNELPDHKYGQMQQASGVGDSRYEVAG